MQEKEQKISPVKQRILQFADTLNISKREFYKIIGVSRGTLESNTGITEDILAKFIVSYPDVDIEWLITGKEKGLKKEPEKEKYGTDITPLLDRIEKLSAENALLKRENEELNELHKKTGRSTDVPLSMVAEPEIGYKEKVQKP
jgi:hypothetical protein